MVFKRQYLICKLFDSKFMDGVYTSSLGLLHVLLKSLLIVFNIKQCVLNLPTEPIVLYGGEKLETV